jgi:hypothetical protein
LVFADRPRTRSSRSEGLEQAEVVMARRTARRASLAETQWLVLSPYGTAVRLNAVVTWPRRLQSGQHLTARDGPAKANARSFSDFGQHALATLALQ